MAVKEIFLRARIPEHFSFLLISEERVWKTIKSAHLGFEPHTTNIQDNSVTALFLAIMFFGQFLRFHEIVCEVINVTSIPPWSEASLSLWGIIWDPDPASLNLNQLCRDSLEFDLSLWPYDPGVRRCPVDRNPPASLFLGTKCIVSWICPTEPRYYQYVLPFIANTQYTNGIRQCQIFW